MFGEVGLNDWESLFKVSFYRLEKNYWHPIHPMQLVTQKLTDINNILGLMTYRKAVDLKIY